MIQSSILAKIKNLNHGFLTDHSTETKADYDRLAPTISSLRQVHGSSLLWSNQKESKEREGDAIATKKMDHAIGVFSADCSPILIVAHRKETACAIMAIHAGWRGAAQLIAAKSLKLFVEEIGVNAQFSAAIGPCIGFSSFEVGEDVIAAFPGSREKGLARFLREEAGKNKYLFDLPGENSRQLYLAAKDAAIDFNLELLPHCTFREAKHFPSYRRDKEKAGRLFSFLSINSRLSIKSGPLE